MNSSKTITLRMPTRRQWTMGIILFACYLIASLLGSRAFTAPAVVSMAAGIGLAGLVLEGTALWPAIYFGSLIAYLIDHVNGVQVFPIIVIPAAQAFQAWLGAWLLKKLRFDPLFNHLRDALGLLIVAFVSSVITPTFGIAAYRLNQSLFGTAAPALTWGSWWAGVILSIVLVAPLAIRWLERPFISRTQSQIRELAIVLGALIILSTLLFWTPITTFADISLVYFLLIPLFWMALRAGPRFTLLGIALTGASGIASVFWGPTAGAAGAGVRLFQTEILLIIIAGMFLVLVCVEEDRKDILKIVRSEVEQLQDDVGTVSFQSRAKSEFLAVLAHELRNPLAPMVSSLELLRLEGLVYTEGLPVLDLLDDRIMTIRRLLDDILDISRISENKLRLQKEYTELQTVIARAAEAVEGKLEERNQTLSINVPKDPIRLHIDPVRIEQVITNLLSNASKFTDSKGNISISVREPGGIVEIHVRDSGIGIDPEMVKRIFEPFLQVEGRRANEGLGIGLSIAKRLVELHDGTIEARSKGTGHGTEFIIRLPRITSGIPQEATRHVSVPLYRAGANHRVLVVDDNSAAAHGIGKLLEYMGYLVDYAYSGKEAIEKSAKSEPRSIVLDIGLPDLDGYATALAIREKNGFKGMLIALTGYGQEEDKQKAYAAGFDHHLTKPIGIADLQAILIDHPPKS